MLKMNRFVQWCQQIFPSQHCSLRRICPICCSSFGSFVSIPSVNRKLFFCSHTSTNSGKSSSVTVIRSTQSCTVLQAGCCQLMVWIWKVTLTLHLYPITVPMGTHTHTHTHTHLSTTIQPCSLNLFMSMPSRQPVRTDSDSLMSDHKVDLCNICKYHSSQIISGTDV